MFCREKKVISVVQLRLRFASPIDPGDDVLTSGRTVEGSFWFSHALLDCSGFKGFGKFVKQNKIFRLNKS